MGCRYVHATIKRVIKKLGYSFQKNQKYNQVGKAHPERDAQFRRIAEERASFEDSGDPIISIDTKAKMQLGNYYHSEREWRFCTEGDLPTLGTEAPKNKKTLERKAHGEVNAKHANLGCPKRSKDTKPRKPRSDKGKKHKKASDKEV